MFPELGPGLCFVSQASRGLQREPVCSSLRCPTLSPHLPRSSHRPCPGRSPRGPEHTPCGLALSASAAPGWLPGRTRRLRWTLRASLPWAGSRRPVCRRCEGGKAHRQPPIFKRTAGNQAECSPGRSILMGERKWNQLNEESGARGALCIELHAWADDTSEG